MNRFIVSLLLLITCHTLLPMQKENESQTISPFKALGCGAVAGVAEVTINQPTIYIKNRLQEGQRIDLRNLYKGYSLNAASMAPTTALQVGIDRALEKGMPGNDTKTRMERAFVAGMCSAFASTPTELIILHKQQPENKDKTSLALAREIKKSAGYRGLCAGLLPTAIRDGIFTVGFLAGQPWIKDQLIDAGYNEKGSSLAGGGLAGIIAAILTQPLDTIKTWRQSDPAKKKYKNYLELMHRTQDKGWTALYRGTTPRAIRAGLAIMVLSTVKDFLTNLF